MLRGRGLPAFILGPRLAGSGRAAPEGSPRPGRVPPPRCRWHPGAVVSPPGRAPPPLAGAGCPLQAAGAGDGAPLRSWGQAGSGPGGPGVRPLVKFVPRRLLQEPRSATRLLWSAEVGLCIAKASSGPGDTRCWSVNSWEKHPQILPETRSQQPPLAPISGTDLE